MGLLTFKIDNVEFIDCIAERGLKWSKNDLDDNAERTFDGVMHRNKIADKIKLDISLMPLKNNILNKLNAALNKEYVNITYYDPLYGSVTKKFYGTSISCAVAYEKDNVLLWENGSFSLTEV